MQGIIPHPKVKALIADLAVGLAADSDNPERIVENLLLANLKQKDKLPFVGFLDHNGKWVDGYGGSLDKQTLLDSIARAEKAPALQSSPKTRKKYGGLALRARKAAEKKDWRTVIKQQQKASKLWGRCPERNELRAIVARARAWAEEQFAAARKAAASGDDLAAIEKSLVRIKNDFRGEPEADAAVLGLKAVKELAAIRATEQEGRNEERRKEAALNWKDSPWAVIFAGSEDEEDEESEIEIGE